MYSESYTTKYTAYTEMNELGVGVPREKLREGVGFVHARRAGRQVGM